MVFDYCIVLDDIKPALAMGVHQTRQPSMAFLSSTNFRYFQALSAAFTPNPPCPSLTTATSDLRLLFKRTMGGAEVYFLDSQRGVDQEPAPNATK